MKKEEQKKKKKKQGRRITVFAVVLGAVIVLGIAGAIIFQSGVIENRSAAVTIDGKDYRLSEFNYYYYAYYNSYLDDYSEYVGYMFDESKPLKDQKYDEDQSWFDFFREQALESMTGVIETAELAREAGYELSDEAQSEMDSVMESIRSAAESAGVDTDQYLEDIYGKGMNEKLYQEHLTNSHLAAEYSDKLRADQQFSPEEIEAYYQEHLAEYTYVNYERFYVKASEVDTKPTKQQKKDALETAQKIFDRVEKGEELKEVSRDFEECGTYYSFDDAYYDPSFSYGKWLFSADRKDGDAKVIDDGSGYYVMVFHSRDESSYLTADIVDVSFPVDSAAVESGTEDDKDKINQLYEDSCTNAESLLADWEAGEKTAESFRKLASEQEGASGTVSTYTDLTKGTLDEAIEKWVFDSAGKEGDAAVIYTESGFHVVYYTGPGKEAWKVKAENDLRDEAHDTWYQEILDHATVKQHDYVLKSAGGEINK